MEGAMDQNHHRRDTFAPVDLLIVGGGINGAGIARDAAGRGLGVLLVEQDDLAAHTSSASTKLIHGGLRYLEQYAFRLVRESLVERKRLLRLAPHIVRPIEFVLPHRKGGRPALPEKYRKSVTVLLDDEVIEHFKVGEPGWMERVNAALRKAAGLE